MLYSALVINQTQICRAWFNGNALKGNPIFSVPKPTARSIDTQNINGRIYSKMETLLNLEETKCCLLTPNPNKSQKCIAPINEEIRSSIWGIKYLFKYCVKILHFKLQLQHKKRVYNGANVNVLGDPHMYVRLKHGCSGNIKRTTKLIMWKDYMFPWRQANNMFYSRQNYDKPYKSIVYYV